MKFFDVFLLTMLLAATAVMAGGDDDGNECGENEVMDDCCKRDGCNTCEEPDREKHWEGECVPGCRCSEGCVRNSDDVCVPYEHCESGCGGDPNARYDPCGDICPTTCANRNSPVACAPGCDTNGGCRCKTDFVRDHEGKCVKPEECPKCGDNEEFRFDACDSKCETLGEPCATEDRSYGCFCKSDCARDKSNKCIPTKKCPPRQCKDDPNAIVLPCGDPCPVTCDNKDNPPKVCNKMCIKNGCKCKDGFVRENPKGKCIPAKKCPPKLTCKENEEYHECDPQCPLEKTCATHCSGKDEPCTKKNKPCTPCCRCKAGCVRHNGKCVETGKCCSDPNCEMVKNPSPCSGGTCAKPKFDKCTKKADPFGCQCKTGHVWISEKNKKCVPLKSCSSYK